MSIPSTKQNLSQAPISMAPRMSTGHVEKFEKQAGPGQNGNGAAMPTGTLSKKAVKQQLLASSHKRKYSQSKQPVEHDSSEDKDQEEPPVVQQQTFRSRSKTISDTSGKGLRPAEIAIPMTKESALPCIVRVEFPELCNCLRQTDSCQVHLFLYFQLHGEMNHGSLEARCRERIDRVPTIVVNKWR